MTILSFTFFLTDKVISVFSFSVNTNLGVSLYRVVADMEISFQIRV